MGRIKGGLRPLSISHLLSAETRPEVLLKNSLGNNFLWALLDRLWLGGAPAVCSLHQEVSQAANVSFEPGHLHGWGLHSRPRRLTSWASCLRPWRQATSCQETSVPHPGAQGCGPAVAAARSSRCVPFCSSSPLV